MMLIRQAIASKELVRLDEMTRGAEGAGSSRAGSGAVRFGPFAYDPEAAELRRDGRAVKLTAQPARLLELLLAVPGHTVTREQIRESIWDDSTHVDFDQGINHCIRQLRAALGDQADRPLFVETVPRRGYRFVAPVERAAPAVARRGRIRPRRVGALTAAAVLLLALAGLALRQGNRPSRPMLVVLPFQDYSVDGGQPYLGDALTEELITQLGRGYSGRLGVIARTSAMSYRDTSKSVQEIGAELAADFVLEGSVRRDGDRVRVTAQLIRVSDQAHLWAANYDRRFAEILDVQTEVSLKIAEAMALELLPAEERASAAATPEAYDAYLRGRHQLGLRTRAGIAAAREELERAVALDPGFAPAYAALARTIMMGEGSREETIRAAREAARQALALDDSQAEAHQVLAAIRFYHDYDLEGARRSFERALRINPAFAEVHHAFAAYWSVTGQHDEAIAEVQRALALDPLKPMVNADVGWYYYFARRYDEAILHSRRTLELSPGFYWAHRCIILANLQKGDVAAAVDEARAEMRELGEPPESIARLDAADPGEAMRAYWRWDLARSDPDQRDPSDVAFIRLALGDKDRAVQEFVRSFEERRGWQVPFLRVDPRVDSLRQEPRFRDLLERIDRQATLLAAR